MLPKHNKVWTQRIRFSVVFIWKTSKITPEGKFTANKQISVIYYIFVKYGHRRILTAYCCTWWLMFYCPWVQWIALQEQICTIAPVISRLVQHKGDPQNWLLMLLKTDILVDKKIYSSTLLSSYNYGTPYHQNHAWVADN